MATVAHTFSPKEFQCWVISDNTDAGVSGIHASNMYQLDVDSVSYPSLNLTQALEVRSGVGRTLKDEDFFQDNTIRVVELSLSGTLHNDAGHKLLLQNICNDVSDDISVASGHTGATQLYGAGNSVANSASSLTVVIKSSDHSNQRSLEFPGMVVTNMSISADNGTEGGRYKFSATLQSGVKPDLNESTVAAGSNVYANTTNSVLSSGSGFKVMNSDVVMNSFTATIDHPAVFAGATSTGYEVVGRGTECAVTIDTQVKYDGNTKTLVHGYDTQSAPNATNSFVIVNNNAFGIDVQNAIYTNVAYSEAEIMMLDISMKSVDNGTNPLITFDVSA